MKKTRLLHGLIFLILLVGLTSCYTRLGYVSDEPVYDGNDQYSDQDGQFYDDAQGQDQEVIVNHIYLPPRYHPGYIYFDPYDEWYFEPGFGFWFSYYSGPVYISVPFYYPPYPYPYPYPVCYPPVYYPGPVYYPPVWGGGYYGSHYAYSTPPLKRREFGRRTEMVYTAPRALSRRSSGSDGSGSGSLSRRTLTKAPDSGSDNSDVSGRRVDGRRGQTYTPPPDNSDYGRYSTRRRTETTSDQKDSDNKRRTSNSSSSGSYSPGQSTNSEPGYSAPASRRSSASSGSVSGSSGQKSNTPKVSSPPSRRSSSVSSRPTVNRSSNSSDSKGSSSTTTSRPKVSRSSSSSGSSSSRSSGSSSSPSVSRSSSRSSVSSGSVSRPSPARSSSGSSSSRSSSSSGKSRRR